MQTPIDMTRSKDHIRAAREAKQREVALAWQAGVAELAIKAEATGRLNAQTKAVPSELFADDPEIMALRTDYEVKQRQRPVVSNADPARLHQVIEDLKERVKAGTLDAMIAAVEDVMTRDPTLRRAMVIQRQVDEVGRKLELLTKAQERLSRVGFNSAAREREQLAGQALEAALTMRKLQYVREHPEPLEAAAPAVARTRFKASPSRAQFSPEENDDEFDFPNYAAPVTQAAEPPPSTEGAPAADDVVEV